MPLSLPQDAPRRALLSRVVPVALLAAMLSMPAQAADTGDLQYVYTAFLDVPAAFKASLAACRKVAPKTVPALEREFEHWRTTHAADQPLLQQLLIGAMRERGAPDEVDAMLVELKAASAPGGPIVAEHFPTASVQVRDCEIGIPAALSGKDLMINFHDYVVDRRFTPAPSAASSR